MGEQTSIDTSETFDAVLIGSGPINIIESAYLKSQGKKVLIIEERSHPAGAWTTIEHPNIPEVEIGCHIWDVDQASYDFLAQFFKLDLVPLAPKPRIYKKRVRFPYDWKMNAMGFKQIVKRSSRLQFGTLRREFNTPVYRLSLLPANYLYPKNGARDIKEAIQRTIDNFQIPVAYNTRVEKLVSNPGAQQVELTLNDGQSIRTKECVLTSLSSIPHLEIDGNSVEFAYRSVDYVHMHLLLKGFGIKKISYDRVMDSAVIHRVSDMTSQVKADIDSDACLLCVGIFEAAFKSIDSGELENAILNELKRLKYIKGNGQIVASGVNSFPAFYNQPALHDSIQKQSNHTIRVMRSTNFTYGIAAQLDRWQSLLK